MAHHAKFVSVNPNNKSYGRNNNASNAAAGASGGTHARYGRHASSYGSSGGMVVLSRPKAAPKLSVPPPLNLPSLRKEHERFDPSGPGSVSGRTGLGPGPGSHTAGWTKPAVFKDPSMNDTGTGSGSQIGGAVTPSSQSQSFIDKAVILKGEDFPTLCAATHTLPSKQNGSNRVEKKKSLGEEGLERRPVSPIVMDMRPQVRPQCNATSNSQDKGDGGDFEKQRRVDELLPSPLQIVRVQYKSDWADDERDTGLSLPERDRTGFMTHEPGLNRDFYNTTGRDVETSGAFKEFYRDSFGKDSVFTAKDAQDVSWRSPVQNQRGDRYDISRPYSAGRGNNTQSSYNNGYRGNSSSFHNIVLEDNSNNWYRGNSSSFQKNSGTKVHASPLSNNKGFMLSDAVSNLNFAREKRTTLSPAKPTYVEDSSFDPIAEVNLNVLKRKKEIKKEREFHDPARESFEAELDNILRMQEMERQRANEERTRALEMARREEEERERLMREERERVLREEDEARRAAWQAEQEKLESVRRAEELRIAREEEKRRIFLEEERRKEAARQKLLELEARIARRHAESNARGEINNNTNSNFRDIEGRERQVERVNTASSDSSTMNRYFSTSSGTGIGSRIGTMRDGIGSGNNNINSAFVDRGESHAYYGPGPVMQDTFGSGSVRHGGSVRKDQNTPDVMGTQRWENNNSGFNRQESELEPEFLDRDRFGDAGWIPTSDSPQAQYDMNESFSSFNRSSRYGLRQPWVLPPPAVTRRGPVTDDMVPTSSSLGAQYRDPYLEMPQQNASQVRMEEQEESTIANASTVHLEESEENACSSPRFESQSSVSVTSPPVSTPQILHDEIDMSGDLPAPPTSAETPQSYTENADMDDDEWAQEGTDNNNNGEINRAKEYEEEAEEEDVNDKFAAGEDFADVSGEVEQIILGFDEGVQVPIPRNGSGEYEIIGNDIELESENIKGPTSEVLEETIGETEREFSSLSLEQVVSSPLVLSQDKVTGINGLPAPIMPPPSSQVVSSQSEMPVNLQFGLFSGPSLIPTPIPAIQIGSIQMPIHLHSHLNPALPQIQPPQGPLFQFGQLRYAPPVVSQGISSIPSQTVTSFIQPVNPYMLNPNPVSAVVPLQTNFDPSRSSSQEKVVNTQPLNLLEDKQNKESEKPKERTSMKPAVNKEPQVPVQFSVSETRVSNKVPSRGSRYGCYNNHNNNIHREIGTRFIPTGAEISRKDSRGGYHNRRPRRGVRRTEFRVRESSERKENPEKRESHHAAESLSIQDKQNERNETGTQVGGTKSSVSKPRMFGVSEDLVQSGVVRVFEQPGIEVPNDENGFIEVRSKKQMLNDRREKREREKEREIKPKLRMQKVSRKHRQDAVVRSNLNRNKGIAESTVRSLSKVEPSGSSTSKSLLLTDAAKADQTVKIGSSLLFEDAIAEKPPLALGSWDNALLNQQVMPLTQSQLDDAMKPLQFEQQTTQPIIPAQEKLSPINSLLAGEKIQFGAVTSPAVLPPVSRSTTSNGLGAPGSSRPGPLTKTEPAPIHFFDNTKTPPEEQVAQSEEEEAVDEAEAAASAVAVAAISNDDVGAADVSMMSEPKTVPSADAPALTPGGLTTSNNTPNQSEECSSLTVALPADLSVDTQSLTMWPPLASPQSSTPILSQFPPQPSSHFSCFDMNPAVLNGAHHHRHILSFSHDESAVQNQRGVTAWPGPQPSGVVDSFYRSGFGGPFIAPGGIQGPPHMVVYNHFAPVGQFGQVGQFGLSFVGPAPAPAYISSAAAAEKQANEWKQNVGQGDMNCQNAGVSQSMAGPAMTLGSVQHIRPTSALLPMPMFDISPFQPSGEMPMQPCWPHMPPGPPPLNTLPLSIPARQQHQIDLQIGHNPNLNPNINHAPFREPPTLPDKNRAPQFHDELGPVERPPPATGSTSHTVPPGKNEGTGTKSVVRATTAVVSGSGTVKSPNGNGTMIDRRGKNEWHRRGVYHHGRKQGSGQEKGFGTGTGTGRIKQIYVAKSNSTSSVSVSSGTSNV